MTTFVFQDSNDISEIDRKKAEHERVKAETQRIENEESRKLDEENRKSSETTRQEFYENTAIPLVENLRDFDSQITKNTKEIDNSKGKYDTLKARLDRENEKVYETINDKDFLPFEGQNVTVEHSKVGFTKGIKLEGMTYHNLATPKRVTVESSRINMTINNNLLKSNTTYSTNLPKACQYGVANLDGTWKRNTYVNSKLEITLGENEKIYNIFLAFSDGYKESDKTYLDNAIILEGSNVPIPNAYFEGIKSVGEKEGKISILSTGRNLLPPFEEWILSGNTKLTGENEVTQVQTTIWEDKIESPFISVIEGTYKLTCTGGLLDYKYQLQMRLYNSKKEQIGDIVYVDKTTLNFGSNVTYIKLSINSGGSLSGTFIFKNWQLEKDIQTPYCPYKVDKKEILLTDGLKGLPSGAGDTVETREDGVYHVQKVRKIVFDGSSDEDITLSSDNDNFIKFAYTNHDFDALCETSNIICDTFPTGIQNVSTNLITGEYVYIGARGGWSIIFVIKKSKLETLNVTGFKKWLQANPTTIYYELETPIETKLIDFTSTNLETFKDITHVLSQNAIAPKLSFKAPVDVPATLSSLRSANTILMAQNTELQAKNEQLEEVNKKQTTKIIELDDTTSFLIEDALTRKLNN